MAHPTALFSFPRTLLARAAAAALSGLAASVAAQSTAPAAQTVTVTGRSLVLTAPAVAGFGDVPLAESPLQATSIAASRLADSGTQSLAEATRFDAAVTDAYNADGYWSNLAIRGYVLDNRYNYRRDGLPISAETALHLGNKERIDVLKGTSGIQAGTSAPGGLVDLVVKRPRAGVRGATLGWRESGSFGAAVDIGERFGADQRYGVRINAAAERLDPQTHDLEGRRHLLAIAADWRIGASSLLEAEIETSHQRQPSLPGFSMLGNAVPDPERIDPRRNLNNQPWSLPVVFDGTTASLRFTQRVGDDWQAVVHGMTQRLTTDDRIAFPFGCSAEGNFDRYCSDGTFDFYDFRSEGERRRSDALDVSVQGRATTGPVTHRLAAGVLATRYESRLNRQAFNFVGTGRIDGGLVVPADPTLTDENTNRDERSTELYLRDAMRFGERWGAWLGLRHARLSRASVRTDGSRPTDYDQSFTTPWLAVSYTFGPGQLVYASWGRGVESYVTPNRSSYANPGAPLPAQKSRQVEVGVKGRVGADVQWSVAAFDIDRPFVADTGTDFFVDGAQRHRGVEAQVDGRAGAWSWLASASALKARYEGRSDPASNGVRPFNVPARSAKLMLAHDLAALPGLTLSGWVVHEGDRTLLPAAGSPTIPAWTRLDVSARYTHRAGPAALTWRVGVDNVADRRAWKESPYQFGHVYLYPLGPRTWRASLEAAL